MLLFKQDRLTFVRTKDKYNNMKKTFPLVLMISMLALSTGSMYAQLRKIPAEVTNTFSDKYPGATSVEWKDRLTGFTAAFNYKDEDYIASFSNKGEWENTEQKIEEADIPAPVTEGFSKSKYADWTISEVHKIELPADVIQYRLEVASGDIKKRNLTFNDEGRLLKDKLTL
jgi:Putative beta-lactamase-inhibitor-like, PepSY-like